VLLEACVSAGLDIENGLHSSSRRPGSTSCRPPQRRLRFLAPARPEHPVRRHLRDRQVAHRGSDCAMEDGRLAGSTPRPAPRSGASSSTGQTGIATVDSVDAVLADFIAGASEQLVLEGIERRSCSGSGPARSTGLLGVASNSSRRSRARLPPGRRRADSDERFPIPPLSELVSPSGPHCRAAGDGSRDRPERARSRRRARVPQSPRRRTARPSASTCTLRYSRSPMRCSRIGLSRTMSPVGVALALRPRRSRWRRLAKLIVRINDGVKYEVAQLPSSYRRWRRRLTVNALRSVGRDAADLDRPRPPGCSTR
jgi:hypothetical protein